MSNETFLIPIRQNNDLSDIVNRGYETVKERSIEKVGEQLKSIYEAVYDKK